MNRSTHDTLARALALGTPPARLLAELHGRVLDETGGSRAVVLQRSVRSGDYVAASDSSEGDEPAVWFRGEKALKFETLLDRGAAILCPPDAPALLERLGAPRALLVPIPNARARAALVVASPRPADPRVLQAAVPLAVEFGIALEWARLARESDAYHRLRELSLFFAREVTSGTSLAAVLQQLAHDTRTLLGASRASVWIHNRRAREIVLAASSDPAHAAAARSVSADDPAAPAARGLRLDRPQFLRDEPSTLVAPLRGWRRALGTLVVEGPTSPDLDQRQAIEIAHELGRQLSVGIENVQLLEEVLQQRRRLEDTFNSLLDLVVVTDTDLRIVQMNDAFAARLDRPRSDLLDRRLAEVLGDEIAAWAQGNGPEAGPPADTDSAGRTRIFEHARLGGTFAATVTPLINENGVPVGRVVVARDITVQTRLEAEREALRGRLAQSEKLAALGQFVAGIAHEMNNPLQGVLGHLELLIDTSPEARPIRRDLRRIYQEGERAAKIVRNLLVFTGARRMVRRRLRIDRALSRALTSRRAALLRQGIEVVRRQDADLPAVLGDPLLLQEAFLNVLINAEHAIAAARAPGRIEITTSAAPGGRFVVVTVRDNGPGVPPDVLPRIFDPFFTTKDVGQGTGLGLAITYGILQEHGGSIQAANAPGGGAVFTIELPADTAGPVPRPARRRKATKSRSKVR